MKLVREAPQEDTRLQAALWPNGEMSHLLQRKVFSLRPAYVLKWAQRINFQARIMHIKN